MKAFTLLLGACAAWLLMPACSQRTGYDDYETATPASDDVPAWLAENSDPAYETGHYDPINPTDPSAFNYNPPPKPTVSSGSKAKGKKSAAKSKSRGKARTYTVKKGDTLGAIARRHGTSVKAIKRANKLRSDLIHINQKLTIPRK